MKEFYHAILTRKCDGRTFEHISVIDPKAALSELIRQTSGAELEGAFDLKLKKLQYPWRVRFDDGRMTFVDAANFVSVVNALSGVHCISDVVKVEKLF